MAGSRRSIGPTLAVVALASLLTVGLVAAIRSTDDRDDPQRVRTGDGADASTTTTTPSATAAASTATSAPATRPSITWDLVSVPPMPPDDPFFRSIADQYGVDLAQAQVIARRQAAAEAVTGALADLVGDDWVGARLDPADGMTMHVTVSTDAARALIQAQQPPEWVVLRVGER